MKKNYILLLLFLVKFLITQGQVKLSDKAEVSIITAGSGGVLYEAFGHSAIRIKDASLQFDLIYNYGIFDFNQPNFYTNFTKGKLLYQLGKYDFEYFLRSYQRDKRWVKEQVLNLTKQQKQEFFNFLEHNALPENASYLYDPFYDNCATKLRDITMTILGDKVNLNYNSFEKNLSFRDLMNNEIHWNTWGSFGINLALGSKLDKKVASNQYLYLPKYVFEAFDNSSIYLKNQSEPLVKKENTLLSFPVIKSTTSLFDPLLVFIIISLLGIFITYKDYKSKKRTKWLDWFLCATSGVLGALIVFLWFFTNHVNTVNNFNILWAFPLNIVLPYLLKNNNKKLINNYLKLLIVFLTIIPAIWVFKLQIFPVVLLPIFLLLTLRYIFLLKLLTFKK